MTKVLYNIPPNQLRKPNDPDWHLAPEVCDKLEDIVIHHRLTQFWDKDESPWYSYTLWFRPTLPVSTVVGPIKVKEGRLEILVDVPEDARFVTYNAETGMYYSAGAGELPTPPYSWPPFAGDPGDPKEIERKIKRALSRYVHTV